MSDIIKKVVNSFLSDPSEANSTDRDCKNCYYSEFKGRQCKKDVDGTPSLRDIVNTKEAVLCSDYTTVNPTLDAETKAEVITVQTKTDAVKTAVEGIVLDTENIELKLTDVTDAIGISNSKLDDNKTAIDANKTSTDTVKTAVDALKGLSEKDLTDVSLATEAVYDKTLDLETAIGSSNSKLDTVKTAVDALKGSGTKTLTDLATDLGTLKTSVDSTKTAVDALKGGTPKTLADLNTVLSGNATKLDTLKTSVDTNKAAVDALKGSGTKTLTDLATAINLVYTKTLAVESSVLGLYSGSKKAEGQLASDTAEVYGNTSSYVLKKTVTVWNVLEPKELGRIVFSARISNYPCYVKVTLQTAEMAETTLVEQYVSSAAYVYYNITPSVSAVLPKSSDQYIIKFYVKNTISGNGYCKEVYVYGNVLESLTFG